MLRNRTNRPSDTKFDDLIAQITSYQVLPSFWVNYRGELLSKKNVTGVATGVLGAGIMSVFICISCFFFEVLYGQ